MLQSFRALKLRSLRLNTPRLCAGMGEGASSRKLQWSPAAWCTWLSCLSSQHGVMAFTVDAALSVYMSLYSYAFSFLVLASLCVWRCRVCHRVDLTVTSSSLITSSPPPCLSLRGNSMETNVVSPSYPPSIPPSLPPSLLSLSSCDFLALKF